MHSEAFSLFIRGIILAYLCTMLTQMEYSWPFLLHRLF
jgi:hypothetical protein